MNTLMQRSAVWYARHGWYVFPVHTPLFDDAGQCIGCTCEQWRRSDECKAKFPGRYLTTDQHCETPGKCPRVRWAEKSTTDLAQLYKWWRWWPDANIGIDCGKSNLLVFDVDSYKQVGDVADLLTWDERQTVTAITGGGGEHLVYDRQGLPYGNATGDLAHGFDIRGVGGYIVACPSLHGSGQRYQWEEGYSPHEIKPLPLPATLAELLESAQIKAQPVTFTSSTDCPNLAQWVLPQHLVNLLADGHTTKDRSRTDQRIITALIERGATDDEIRAVFVNSPIGQGKYAEAGDRYLAFSISKARSFVAKNPSKRRQAVVEVQL